MTNESLQRLDRGVSELPRTIAGRLADDFRSSLELPADVNREELIHDLQVRLAELEMQNDELRRSEAVARNACRTYQQLFEIAPVGCFVWDAMGTIQLANLAAAALLGLTRRGTVGARFGMFIIEVDRSRFAAFCEQAIHARGKRASQFKLIKGERLIEVSLEAIPASNGEAACGLCCAAVLDVTDRLKAEECEREYRVVRHLLQSSDHERQLIAYEIHDGLAQYLAGAIMHLEVFHHIRDSQPGSAADTFAAGMAMLRQSHYEARRLISGVRPPILDEEGIVVAVEHLVNERRARNEAEIEYRSRVDFDRLIPIVENSIYRIVQESLTNACRYSRSKRIWVELVQDGEQLRIEVRDEGIGFSLTEIGDSGFGLPGIRERARLLGGMCSIESAPGKGTRIVVELPIVPRSTDPS